MQPIFRTSVSRPSVQKVTEGFNDELQVSPDGRRLFFTNTSLMRPAEIYRSLYHRDWPDGGPLSCQRRTFGQVGHELPPSRLSPKEPKVRRSTVCSSNLRPLTLGRSIPP